MKKIFLTIAVLFTLFFCSCTKDYVTPSNQSVLDNINIVVSDDIIFDDCVLVNISLFEEFGEGVVGHGICVAANNVPSFNDDKYPNLDNSQNYSIILFDLQPGTTYYISYYVIYYDGQVKYSTPVQFTTRINDKPIIKSKLWGHDNYEYSSGVTIDENSELSYEFYVTSSIELKSIRVYVRENMYDLAEYEYTVDEMDVSGNYTFTYENQFSYSSKGHIIGNCTIFCIVENMLGNVSSSSIVININSNR